MKASVKYKVIYRHKDSYSISEMCRFFEVSRSGYYDFVNIEGEAREIGQNSSVIRQYVIGDRKPSAERKEQIVAGFKSLADKMQHAVLS